MRSVRSLPRHKSRRNAVLAVLAAVLVAIPVLIAQPTPLQSSPVPSSPLEKTDPGELVRQAVANEVAAFEDPSVKHQFRSRKQTPHGSQTKLYVETRDAMAGMVIAYNDRPVTEAELAGEQAHLQGLRDQPEQLRHKQSQEKETTDRFVRILKALPLVYVYEYDGTETATADFGKAGEPLVRLKFRPNPNYNPPSHLSEQALGGTQGTILIDAERHRIARIEGTVFKDVNFAWGFLGKLDKGGHFLIAQTDVGDGTWEITRMTLSFTGKLFLFKSFNLVSDEVLSDFRRVPATLTFAQGVDLLKTEQAKLAQNHVQNPAGSAH
ncbi:MAG: hypothetical protein WBQ08_20655 [Candidatus Sulfotelmatobacter sp.]